MTKMRGALFVLALSVAACDAFKKPYEDEPNSSSSLPSPPSSSMESLDCVRYTGARINPERPYQPVLYAWLSDEEAEELKQGKQLLRPREQLSTTALDLWELSETSNDPVVTEPYLMDLAKSTHSVRHAWPFPWASHQAAASLGEAGKLAERDRLVRIVLSEQAWITIYYGGQPKTFASDNTIVPEVEVAAQPERIAAILTTNGPVLRREFDAGALVSTGVPLQCSVEEHIYESRRSFLIVNSEMIKSWSLGSEEAQQRMGADETALRDFLEGLRLTGKSPNSASVCAWQFFDSPPAFDVRCDYTYAQSLPVAPAVIREEISAGDASNPYELERQLMIEELSPKVTNLVNLIDRLATLPKEEEHFEVQLEPSAMGGGSGL